MRQPNTSAQRAQQPTTTDRYTRLPDALLSELPPREHQLVHALLSHKWFEDSAIYPSIRTLVRVLGGKDNGWSVRTVQRTLRRLETDGWIVTIARYREDAGQTSNEYRPGLRLLPYLAPAPSRAATPQRPSWQGGMPARAAEGNSGNQTNRTRRPERPDLRAPARDYYQTSEGWAIKPRT